ncbi:MerR family transcriptional regulator [Kitasatospora aureofaciens]|uniref:DNA polymerase III subunit beta family protein n=1 Tax=Kitasatospora aureofaciens TaxID=1894 RepID=UPI001C4501FE|nr:MerR family transcriptional regulator [Kitasatospora aureofaciens]MBV6697072.1 MerR family transcriptional regulator [Kitasatospora aureofaciens]
MESDLHSIGELARASGLGVGTLRYYDGADVLTPARVDPHTGYRWYGPRQLADARLLARLRRVGLPLAAIRAVLGAAPGSGEAHRVVDAHLRRLEDGLADARRELSLIRTLIDQRENPMTTAPAELRLTVPAQDLAAALDAVRHAVGADPELPVLAGVLFDLDGAVLRLVATDRYRMALAEVPLPELPLPAVPLPAVPDTAVPDTAPPAGAIVPTALVDALRALLGAGAAEAELTLGGGQFRAGTGGHRIEGATLDLDYPDYRVLTRLDPQHRVGLPAAALRGAVESGATRTLPSGPHGEDCVVTVLALGPDGRLAVAPADTEPAPGEVRVAVNRDFLLDALRAGRPEQLVLELGGPIAPLAIRTPGRDGTFSILMPVRVPELV